MNQAGENGAVGPGPVSLPVAYSVSALPRWAGMRIHVRHTHLISTVIILSIILAFNPKKLKGRS